jgi:hypothetical protein
VITETVGLHEDLMMVVPVTDLVVLVDLGEGTVIPTAAGLHQGSMTDMGHHLVDQNIVLNPAEIMEHLPVTLMEHQIANLMALPAVNHMELKAEIPMEPLVEIHMVHLVEIPMVRLVVNPMEHLGTMGESVTTAQVEKVTVVEVETMVAVPVTPTVHLVKVMAPQEIAIAKILDETMEAAENIQMEDGQLAMVVPRAAGDMNPAEVIIVLHLHPETMEMEDHIRLDKDLPSLDGETPSTLKEIQPYPQVQNSTNIQGMIKQLR